MRASPLVRTAIAAILFACPACRGCFGVDGDSSAIASSPRIPVEIDGKAASPIDGALLARISPDFIEGDRRAWKLRSLLGENYAGETTEIEVEDRDGFKTLLVRAGEPREGREPVLAVTRTGEVRVALVLPSEPFPPFHGRGGNRGRGGDPTRIREVRRILLHRVDAGPS